MNSIPEIRGSYQVFSTAQGAIASDGRLSEKHSPFAKILLEELSSPVVSLDDMFNTVKDRVIEDALDASRVQHPHINNNL